MHRPNSKRHHSSSASLDFFSFVHFILLEIHCFVSNLAEGLLDDYCQLLNPLAFCSFYPKAMNYQDSS